MIISNYQTIRMTITAGLFAAAAIFAPSAWAQEAPRSDVASPDVYKVIATNDKTRVIVATWKPGQRDQWHSHPATTVYYLTDCESRIYMPNGKFVERHQKAGNSNVQSSIASHSFENRSNAECKFIIVERE